MISIRTLLAPAAVLFTLTLLAPLAAQAQPAPGPLWVAESQAVLELDRYTGVERSRIPGLSLIHI